MKNRFIKALCLCLAALTLLSACTSGKTPGKTTTTASTTVSTTLPSNNDPIYPDSTPITSGLEGQSVAVGQSVTVNCPAPKETTFFLTTNAAEISSNEYDESTKTCKVTVKGSIPGDAMLVGVSPDGEVCSAYVGVYAPAAEGEEIVRSGDCTYVPSSDNSPAAETVEKAFDKNPSTKWLVNESTASVIIDFAERKAYPINKYSVTSANDEPPRDPAAWTLYGSNDGKSWVELDKQSSVSFSSRREALEFTFANYKAYSQYKFDITANNGAEKLQLADLTLYEVGAKGVQKYNGTTEVKSNATLEIKGNTDFFEGDKVSLECTAPGEVIFITDSEDVVLTGSAYDASSKKASVTISAKSNVESAQLLALCKSDLTFATATVSAVGEGDFINVTAQLKASANALDESGNTVNASALFDNKRGNGLKVNGKKLTVQISLAREIIVNKYAMVNSTDHALDPTQWSFYGSHDGKDWIKLDTRTNETFAGSNLKRIFTTDNRTAYSYYKLELENPVGGSAISITEIQLFREGNYPSWAIGLFEKLDEVNPILTPNDYDSFMDPISNQPVYWSNEALYNPTAVVKDGVVCILYRSQDHPLVSRVGLALSLDGTNFENYPEPVVYPDDADPYYSYEEGGGCEDPRIVKGEDGKYYMYYTAYDRGDKIARLFVAVSDDLVHWEKKGNFIGDAYGGKYKNFRTKSGSVICDMVGEEFIARRMDDGKYWMYFGEGIIYAAYSDDLIHWTPLEDANGNIKALVNGRPGCWDARLVEPGPQAIYSEYGILLIYNGANNSSNGDSMLVHNAYCPGALLFDPHDLTKVTQRSKTYFMYPEKDYELEGLVNNVCFVEGLIYFKGSWYLYYGTADSRLAVAKYTPEIRDDSALDKAISDGSKVTNPSAELTKWLKVAREAKVSAYYTQEWVDDIVKNINNEIK